MLQGNKKNVVQYNGLIKFQLFEMHANYKDQWYNCSKQLLQKNVFLAMLES